MNDINSIIISGRVTKDIEVFQTKSEYSIISISVANNYSEKENDEWKEKTNFFMCKTICKGKQLEYYSDNLKKGSLVSISGTIKQENWSDRDGSNRSRFVLMCDKIITHTQNTKKPEPQKVLNDPWEDETMPF